MATKVTTSVDEIQILRETLGLSRENLARLLEVSLHTISRWESGVGEPSALAVRELRRWLKVLDRLDQVFKPKGIARWFHAPNKILNNKTPFELACSDDGAAAILELLDRIEWGLPA
jgi:transcriptional regulator with XRE-family HTH domain